MTQLALIALVFFGPRRVSGPPSPTLPFPAASRIVGAVGMGLGGTLFAAGLARLGRGLTPLPFPKEGAELVRSGAYRIVRHPMYGGGLILAFGWALCVRSWLTLGYAAALFAFLDYKSRREERWLTEKFPEYGDYQRRVRKLIPYLY